ncbi:MAG TPA: hypothetical protein VN915_11510 [Elusimicrobiota bacterium]|nr:hypothetical protein [Elusimicrobiota bacterium]
MKPLSLFLVLASLAASLPARAQNAAPSCPSNAGGGQSANWGPNYDLYVKQVFDKAKEAAGLTQEVRLIQVKVRSIDGSPISALPKGTPVGGGQTLPTDSVVYGYGLFEIVCDQAQLATFMLHEMRHIKPGDDGKSHFDRVLACRKKMFTSWVNDPSTVLPADVTIDKAMAQFTQAKGAEYQKTCVQPVEKEADDFAFATLPRMGVKSSNGSDPGRDARAQSFKNADLWAKALGESGCDDGHGCLSARADRGAKAAAAELEAQRKAAERVQGMSIDPSRFAPSN